MRPPESPELVARPSPFTAADVLALLQENDWLIDPPSPEASRWAERASSLLGHYARDLNALAALLRLIFEYDAGRIRQDPDAHAVLARHGAREVIRHLALFLLEPVPLDSDRFKQLVESLKNGLELRS